MRQKDDRAKEISQRRDQIAGIVVDVLDWASLTKGGVRMKSPAGISTAYGMTGTQYNADAESSFVVSAADVRPLLAVGWVEMRAETVARG